jgi:primosomal protein N' (replication factor Y)
MVDMRREWDKARGFTNFSEILLEKIKEKQGKGEQTILFLNRRGYHTALVCQSCQESIRCNHCDLAMTFHKLDSKLSCHLCGAGAPPPSCCPKCGVGNPLKYRGVGTEQIEKSLGAILPSLRILRLDADTTKHKGSHEQLLKQFSSGKADVLIGTQMVAKGLHFPSVTLVGVLNSDAGLSIPDFRASETCFQLITQVAGRAGRGELAGEVIIQSACPENSTIVLASQNDFLSFYRQEMAIRKRFFFPPYAQLGKVTFSGPDEEKTLDTAKAFHGLVKRLLPREGYEINPILPSAYAKVKDQYRMQFFIKGPSAKVISRAFSQAKESLHRPGKIKITIDINPTSTYF